MDTFRISKSEKEAIQKQLQNSGNILVWNYASGYLSDDGISTNGVRDLTGIRVSRESLSGYPLIKFAENSDSLTKNLSGITGSGQLASLIAGSIVGNDIFQTIEGFIIMDKEASPLAFYPDGGTAIGIKRFSDWTSIYLGLPGLLDARLLNNIAKEANARVLSEPGVAIEFNGHFLSLHGIKNGDVTIHLPNSSVVYDFDSEEKMGEGKEVKLSLNAGQTRWFRVEQLNFDDK